MKVVEGVVAYRDRPVPSAELTLYAVPEPKEPPAATPTPQAAPPPQQVATANTDESGRFTLGGVAPGKYLLIAEGVIRNVPRFAQRDVVVELAPGDYVTGSLGMQATPAEVAALRARYGLDRPIATQYFDWLVRAARFDFGRSLANGRPVAELISDAAINTATLAVTALLLATLIGLPLGVFSGKKWNNEIYPLLRDFVHVNS